MKKIICFTVSLIMCICLCGCSIKDLGSASEVLSGLQSQLDALILEDESVVEIKVEEYYVWSPEYDACYNALNSKQKELYEILYAAAEQMPDGFVKLCREYDGIMTDIHLAYTAMLNDNAEIFWMPTTYLIGKSRGNGGSVNIAFNYTDGGNKVSYTVDKSQRDTKRSELEKKVKEIVALTAQADSEYEKEKIFNDYICANTEYNTEAKLANTAYGCLVLQNALCEGYSRAFKLLCNEVGIECDLISGISEGEGHMWNSVNIDGIHSFVDVTWNDTSKELLYMYFNITEEQLLYDHSFSPLYKRLSDEDIQSGASFNFIERECTYTGNSYFAQNNLVLDYGYAEKAAGIINQNAREGIYTAAFLIDNDELIEELKTDSTDFLSKIQYRTSQVYIKQYIFERDVLVLFYEVAD